MRTRLIQDVAFGAGGDDEPHLGEGWSAAEPGYRWSVGPRSELWLDHPGDGDLVLEIDASPFVRPPAVEAQRLAVHADGALVGALTLRRSCRRALRIEAGLLSGRRDVRLGFMHPDAARPSDHGQPDDSRPLALSFRRLRLYAVEEAPPREPASSARLGGVLARRRAPRTPARRDGAGGLRLDDVPARTGLEPAQLAARFEGLGDNCEFGLVQRRTGAEPLSLLRFSNIELPQLLRALDADFDGLGDPAGLELSLGTGPRPEHVLFDRSYALTFHTFQHAGDGPDEAALLARQAQRLAFLRRKLLEDLASGEKIFVVRRNPPLTEAEALPLWLAIGRHGPGRLLWATLADAEHPAGTVERLAPGLLRGRLDRLAPDADAHDSAFEAWLEVCANALALAAEE